MAPLTADLLYIDAPTGLAGDMLLAGLLDSGLDREELIRDLRKLELGPWTLQATPLSQQGLTAMQVDIDYPPQHQHRHLQDIQDLILEAGLPQDGTELALKTFRLLAEAEAAAHGCGVEEVHFHEVGAVDSILDICGVCLALCRIGVKRVYGSPLPLSRGWVDCAHGRLPVPAPAVARLLTGLQVQGTELEGELVTPTGAALLRAVDVQQTPPPAFCMVATGRGAGHRSLPVPNAVHLTLGRSGEPDPCRDVVEVIRTNMDDSPGEILAALWEPAFAAGALDLCYVPLLMKKGRPAWQLQMIVPAGQGDRFAAMIFAETGAIGCRITRERRIKVERRLETVETAFGPVQVKISGRNLAPEADSVQEVAAESGQPFKIVYAAALSAAWQTLQTME